MLINRLTLCDFGVFKGRNVLELAPKQASSRLRPIVLFGGLNGAGKTTLLTAVRVGFYGRVGVGIGLSQKAYEQYLVSLVHRSRMALVQPSEASVAIEFEHAQLGVRSSYTVVRSWVRRADAAIESLQVFRNGEALSELTPDQLQSLLNQLVPIGIADLFFFDGEKISDLATQDQSSVLSDSVKRLVGLHLVERLQGDLATYVRQANSGSSEERNELEKLSAQRETQIQLAAMLEIDIVGLDTEIVQAMRELEIAETDLGRMGGAWSKDRETLKSEKEQLLGKIRTTEADLRERLASEAPLGLIDKQLSVVAAFIEEAMKSDSNSDLETELARRAKALRTRLKKILSATDFSKAERAVDAVLGGRPNGGAKAALLPQITRAEGLATLAVLEMRAPAAARQLLQLSEQLGHLRVSLEQLNVQISRMPEDATIAKHLSAIKDLERRLIDLKAKRLQRIREIKAAYWICFELTRSIRRLEAKAESESSADKSVVLAGALHRALDKFALSLKEAKLSELTETLKRSFAKLARKTELISSVEFDPASFAITIRDGSGTEIPKKKLSAGEQQVFAIAVLDALLTCSGRSLPLIIDTPLGRLDSKHRERLVKEYFPQAAHQVVILSTDTEVDEKFYEELAPYLSHSYHLSFDSESGSTTVTSGYFWRTKQEALRDAA
jgi:DNA sulfur modification protein DndD